MIFSGHHSFLLMSNVFMILIFQCFTCAHVQLISFTLWSISNWDAGCQYTLKSTVFSSTCACDLLFSFDSGRKVISWLQREKKFTFCQIAIFPREISGTIYELEVESKRFVSKGPKSTGFVWYTVWGSAAVFILSDLVPQEYSYSQILLPSCWYKER